MIPLALALVLYQSKRDIAAKSNDECTELELDGSHAQALSPEEIHAYYLSVYEKLGSLFTGSQKEFSRKTSPLINHRLELDDRNMILISVIPLLNAYVLQRLFFSWPMPML